MIKFKIITSSNSIDLQNRLNEFVRSSECVQYKTHTFSSTAYSNRLLLSVCVVYLDKWGVD